MAVLEILVAPDPRLNQKSLPLEAISDEERRLINDMIDTLKKIDGYGLAAPQVNVHKRIIVIDADEEYNPAQPRESNIRVLINPVILSQSSEFSSRDEACFSVANYYGPVQRPQRIRVMYLDEHGTEHILEASGILARCIQHEIDHLDGLLFIDHMSSLRRSVALRKSSKAKRVTAEA
jgi:peptide deformylase